MNQRIDLTDDELDALTRRIQRREHNSEIALALGWPVRRVEKMIARHGLKGLRGHNSRAGKDHPCWNGGRIVDRHGYILVHQPGHPHVRKMGSRPGHYIAEHRLVMEKKLGRLLKRSEVVDHINGIVDDNRQSNLRVFASNADHLRATLTGKRPRWTVAGRKRTIEGLQRWRESGRRRRESGA